MIKNIYIKNFRCYKNSEIKGFKRLNLIGGLNNSGKTVLLEALLLNLSPTSQSVITLKRLRGDDVNTKEYPEYAWDNFFLNQNKDNKICIRTENNVGKEITLNIDCDEKADDFKNLEEESNDENLQMIINDFVDNDQILKSVLHLNYTIYGNETLMVSLMAHRNGITAKSLTIIPPYSTANYIPASTRRKPSILARDYGIAEKRKRESDILEALKIVDHNIDALKVSVVGGAHLEIGRNNENFMSISLFGDAINKILTIILTLVNNRSSILLIDEIENGIHYTVQRDFWRFLFTLAAKSDVQIFATTHSLEMLKAFADVSKDFPKDSAYFELFRRKSTNEIDFNLHDLETLNYELLNELPVRGE